MREREFSRSDIIIIISSSSSSCSSSSSSSTSVISNFTVISIPWRLTVDSEMFFFLSRSLAYVCFLLKPCDSRKIRGLTSEFHSKFNLEKRYRTHRFVIHVISGFLREIHGGIH